MSKGPGDEKTEGLFGDQAGWTPWRKPGSKGTMAGKEGESTFNLARQAPLAMFTENPLCACARDGAL